MRILIAMSSYLCVWIGICTAIIEQPLICGVMPSYSNSLCMCLCLHACVHGWWPYCILGCAALTRPNEAETVPWVTSLLSAAPFLQTLILSRCVCVCVCFVRSLVMQEFW